MQIFGPQARKSAEYTGPYHWPRPGPFVLVLGALWVWPPDPGGRAPKDGDGVGKPLLKPV